jgi:hypothetical protein
VESLSERSERVDRDAVMAKTEPHATWSKNLKFYLLVQYAMRNLFGFRTTQQAWEHLLIGAYEGKRFPDGRIIKQGVAPSEVIEMAKADAERWKAGGAKADFL